MWKLIWLVTHCMQRPGSQRMACSKNYEWSFFITACRMRIGMAQQRLRDGLRLWVLSHSGFCLLSYSHSISCSRTSVYHWPFLQSGPSGFWYLFTCWLSFLLKPNKPAWKTLPSPAYMVPDGETLLVSKALVFWAHPPSRHLPSQGFSPVRAH